MDDTIVICSYNQKLLPIKKTTGAVCRDLSIAKKLIIHPGTHTTIGTGVKIKTPIGRCTKVYARSGLPIKSGLMLANGTAVFDADYRGEYIVQLYNFSDKTKTFDMYTRLTQMEIMPYMIQSGQFGSIKTPKIQTIIDQEVYDNFEKTYKSDRGVGKFHSTGTQ